MRACSLPGRLGLVCGALGVLLGACSPARLQPLPADTVAPGPAAGLGRSVVATRGALTYAVAFAGARVLAAIELSTEFALVVHELGDAPRVRHRIALGPPDFDIGDLAVDQTRHEAWVASRDGTVRSFALASGAPGLTWHLGSPATAVAVSDDGTLVATGTDDGIVCLRRRHDSALLQCVVAHEAPIAALDFAPAPGRVAGRPVGRSVARPVARPVGRPGGRPAGRLASAAWDGTVIVWEVPSLAIAARVHLDGSVNDVAFAPDGQRLALARSSARPVRTPSRASHAPRSGVTAAGALVSLWQVDERTWRHLRGHDSVVTAVAWTADGRGLVSASWDGSVRLWDTQSETPVAKHTGFSGLVRDVAADSRGAWVAAGAWSDAERLQDSAATALIELLYRARSRSTMQAGD